HILSFRFEHQLNRSPLRIDAIITLKTRRNPIKTGIAALFRRENIIEYKGPGVYLSILDFHKALAYAGVYALNKERRKMANLSITLIASRRPAALTRYLQGFLGREMEEREPGIHVLEGPSLPIQIIETRRLRGDNNEWLRDLGRRLDAERLEAVAERTQWRRKDARVGAYLEAVLAANIKLAVRLQKEGKMKMPKEFPKIAEEMGWAAMWEAKYRAQGREEGEAQGEAKGRAEGEAKSRAKLEAAQKRIKRLEEENRRLREGGRRRRTV
ncbi:MAG: hypothetical protein LBQ35_04430, partial [Spirochaetaceae bacterium]|nr:hypothetical protein [Spirochaetaceae bacterium]